MKIVYKIQNGSCTLHPKVYLYYIYMCCFFAGDEKRDCSMVMSQWCHGISPPIQRVIGSNRFQATSRTPKTLANVALGELGNRYGKSMFFQWSTFRIDVPYLFMWINSRSSSWYEWLWLVSSPTMGYITNQP